MKYRFYSTRRTIDVQGVGSFYNHVFQTDDEEKASKLRRNSWFGVHITEVSPGAPLPVIPDQVRVVEGMRTTDARKLTDDAVERGLRVTGGEPTPQEHEVTIIPEG